MSVVPPPSLRRVAGISVASAARPKEEPMNRANVLGIVFGSLIAVGACAREASPAKDVEPPGLAVGQQLFPTTASVTEYATWGKERSGGTVVRSAHADL